MAGAVAAVSKTKIKFIWFSAFGWTFVQQNIFYSCSLSLQYYTEPSLSKKAINKPITLKENHDTMFQTFGLLEGTMNGRFFASFCSTKNKQQSGVGMM